MTITKGNYTKQKESYIQGSNTNEDVLINQDKDGEARGLMIFNERLVVHKLWTYQSQKGLSNMAV